MSASHDAGVEHAGDRHRAGCLIGVDDDATFDAGLPFPIPPQQIGASGGGHPWSKQND